MSNPNMLICPECNKYLVVSKQPSTTGFLFKCSQCDNHFLALNAVNICPECQKVEIKMVLISANDRTRPITNNHCPDCKDKQSGQE